MAECRLNDGRRSTFANIAPLILFVLGSDRPVVLFVLLVIVGFDNVAHYRTCRLAAMPARLYQHGNHNFRGASRRITDKPGIILELLALAEPAAQIVVDDLCRAALSREINSGKLESARGPVWFVHHTKHRVGHFVDGGFGNIEAHFSDVWRIL